MEGEISPGIVYHGPGEFSIDPHKSYDFVTGERPQNMPIRFRPRSIDEERDWVLLVCKAILTKAGWDGDDRDATVWKCSDCQMWHAIIPGVEYRGKEEAR